MLEQVIYQQQIIAIIIRHQFDKPGIHFFTPDNFSQQLAYMKRPAGYKIAPHEHNFIQREIFQTQETLFIKKGKVKVNFYNKEYVHIDSRVLETGDTILLANGGHGFEMLEETEMIEVKQGPYSGSCDKVRFKEKNTEYEPNPC